MHRKGFLAVAAALLLAGAGLALARSQSPQPPSPTAKAEALLERSNTVLLVRHAEKDPAGDPKNPGLSERGRERAGMLAKVCGEVGLTHVFTSEYERTRATAAPIAERLGLTAVVVPASKPADLVQVLDGLPPGSVAMVVGHSNTVPDLIARLGAEAKGTETLNGMRVLPDGAYDRLFVLTRPPKDARVAPSLVELRYGN